MRADKRRVEIRRGKEGKRRGETEKERREERRSGLNVGFIQLF